jgi:hypothetical protein
VRKLPTILATGFIAITLWRVGQFAAGRMGGGWPGWVFSVALGAGVYLSAYWTRDSITQREVTGKDGKTVTRDDRRSVNVKGWAWLLLAFFVLADSLFNLAEVWFTVKPPGGDWLLIVATAVYGLFPTVAAAGLGALQGHIDRLPAAPANAKTSIGLALRKRLVAWVEPQAQPTAQQVAPKQATEAQPVASAALHVASDTQPTKREKVLALHKTQPHLSHPQLAEMVGVSRQYVDKVVRQNGHPAREG